jgi:hypothetical protein
MMYRHGLRVSEGTVCIGEVTRAQAELWLIATKPEAAIWKLVRMPCETSTHRKFENPLYRASNRPTVVCSPDAGIAGDVH